MLRSNGRKLSRMKALSPHQCSKLRERGIISCKGVLSVDVLELMSVLSLSYWQVEVLTHAVSQAAAPQPRNVLDLYRATHTSAAGVCAGFIPTSLPELDSTLHGGLPQGTLTELAGPPGCGKTQLCMTLTVVAAMHTIWGGCGLGVVYIDTEATFSAERLVEIARERYTSNPDSLRCLANKVKVHTALTSGDLDRILSTLEEELAAMGERAGLVVVDSMAAPVRRDFNTQTGRQAMDRAAVLSRHAARLKYLAKALHVAVVVTNQITTIDTSHDLERGSESVAGHITAALGNTWAHSVNTRLLLGYLPQHQRLLTVGKSPVSACKSYVVSLEERGMVLDKTATEELQSASPGHAVALQVRSDVDTIIQA